MDEKDFKEAFGEPFEKIIPNSELFDGFIAYIHEEAPDMLEKDILSHIAILIADTLAELDIQQKKVHGELIVIQGQVNAINIIETMLLNRFPSCEEVSKHKQLIHKAKTELLSDSGGAGMEAYANSMRDFAGSQFLKSERREKIINKHKRGQ